jgi:four helix bundle protein
MQHFTKLLVWQRSHKLVLAIYGVSVGFPRSEQYGLTSQLRRAALSVPTNIAEGSKRQGQSDFARFLNIAEGSLAETEYLLIVSRDLGYLEPPAASRHLKEVSEILRMLSALRARITESS